MPPQTSPAFYIDTGDYYLSLRDSVLRYSDHQDLLNRGYREQDITTHDTRLTTAEVATAIRDAIRADPELSELSVEWTSAAHSLEHLKWPIDCNIIVVPEKGGSEGYYVEIYSMRLDEAARSSGSAPWIAQRLISIKTFERERVWTLAQAVSRWLQLI